MPEQRKARDRGEDAAACACKSWRGTWRTLLWGIPHVFCDRCGREVRHA